MAVPLAWPLRRIAGAALTVVERAFLTERFGTQSRVTQLEIDFQHEPIAIRDDLARALGRSLTGQIDEVLLDPAAGTLDRQRAELEAAAKQAAFTGADVGIARLLGALASILPKR